MSEEFLMNTHSVCTFYLLFINVIYSTDLQTALIGLIISYLHLYIRLKPDKDLIENNTVDISKLF